MNIEATETKNSYVLLRSMYEEQRMILNKREVLLASLKSELEQLWLPCSFFGNTLDFDNLAHDEVIKVIKVFGGKWNKTPSSTDARIHYETIYKNFTIRCFSGEPPPNCKIVEYEEEIPETIEPAKIVKRRKLVCTE